jgi:hypothetical protein
VKYNIVTKINKLLEAYNNGALGEIVMPEDTHPEFTDIENKRIYYTLPMALNYQRNSYKLWEAAKSTYEDPSCKSVYNLKKASELDETQLRILLIKHKLALQPNRHVDIWKRISRTIHENWESVSGLIKKCDSDYLQIKRVIQNKYKKGFPYLSGPKIFNYWMYIMSEYGEVELKNRSYIEIAPDTHVIKASVRLGVIEENQADRFDRDTISNIWRELLEGTGIDPIDVHSPLWFWSRSGFEYGL